MKGLKNMNRISGSFPSTLNSLIMVTALAATPLPSYANQYSHPKPNRHIITNKVPSTFSSITETKPESIESMLVQVYERMNNNPKQLDDDFARILSENVLDLF